MWRILGFDYQQLLDKNDYILLKNDRYSIIGSKTYDNGAKVWRWTNSELKIGNYCSIANNVNFILDEGQHTLSSLTNYPFANQYFTKNMNSNHFSKQTFFEKYPQKQGILIGNDVWIGMGSYIMPSVVIGNGATIGANSVVTKNVPDYSIVVGSPAKIIKMKHDQETILQLNKIAWWMWDEKTIENRFEDFYLDVNNFVAKYSV